MSDNGMDPRKHINEAPKEIDPASAGSSGQPDASGGLFDAYIQKINSMKDSGSFSDLLARDALEDADRVIAEAEKRREALRKKQEEEEAIALTDLEVAELVRERAQKRASSLAASDATASDPATSNAASSNLATSGSAALDPVASDSATSGSTASDLVTSDLVTSDLDASDLASTDSATAGSAEPATAAKSRTAKAQPKDSAAGSRTAKAQPKDSAAGARSKEHAEGLPSDEAPALSNLQSETKKKNGRPHRSPLKLLLLLLLCAGAVAGSVILIRKYTPTSRRMSYLEYFGSMTENEAAMILQDQTLPERAVVENGRLYIPYDLVRDQLNGRFFWDEARSCMLFTTAVQTFEIPINSTSYSVIDGALTEDPTSEDSYSDIIVLRNDSGQLFVNLDYLCRYTNVTYSWEKETQHVTLRNVWGDTLTAGAVKDAAVRYEADIKSPILTDLNKGDLVMVLADAGKWLRVLTKDGYIGYAKANRMSSPAVISILNEGFEAPEYPSLAPEEPVSVIWHMLTTRDSNKTIDDATASMSGMDVISPTWFSLADNDGNVDSIGTKAYVKKAHAKDLKVWGLVSDFSADMDTSLVLASTTARRSCIGQLISYAQTLGLDGINLDFEYVEEADGKNFSQFVRELSIACRLSSLVLSVDLVPPYDFNTYLDRLEIATVADYLINMGYDEHYAGSAAGSVASLPYEEGAIVRLLDAGIPAHKLISGIPFYTRIWYTSSDESGQTYVSSEELSMNGVAATLSSWNVTPVWDAEAAQNYAEWTTNDGVLCQIWMEDADSLARKALLIPKYQLGGCAVWVLGFEESSVWPVLSENLSLSQEEALQQEQALIEARAASEVYESEENTEGAQTETLDE